MLFRTDTFRSDSPAWSEDSLGLTGEPTGFTVHAFSPRYSHTGSAVNGWIATADGDGARVYSILDIFAETPTVDLLFTSTTIPLAFVYIASERLTPNFVIASWYDETEGVHIAQTTDGSTFTEVQVSAHIMTDNRGSGSDILKAPAVAVVGNGLAYVAAYSATGDEEGTPLAQATIFKTLDYGLTWSASHGNLGVMLGLSIHIPFHNNPSHSKMYYGKITVAAGHDQTILAYWDGSTQTQFVLPDLDNYGVSWGNRAIATNPTNSQQLVVCARHDTGAGYTLMESPNAGAAWYRIDSGENWFRGCDVDSSGNIFAWGEGGNIALVQGFGTAIQDKRGDLASTGRISGIAGG